MKVTGLQVYWMIAIMDLGMTMIMTLTPSLQAAKQDLWISLLLAGLIVLVITLLVTKVALLYPGLTLIQICQGVLGKFLGSIVIVIYMIQWYTIIPIVLRQFNDLVQILLLPTTPKMAILIIMILLIVYVTYSGGIEGIARVSEILGPIILLMVLLVLIASIKNINLNNLMPIFADSGVTGIIKGSLAPASYLGHSVEYLMLAAFLYHPRMGTRYTYWAVITAATFVLLSAVVTASSVGVNLAPKTWYPFFEMTRKISLWGFLENFDPFTIVIWVSSVFIKLAIYLFVTCYGTAQFLRIKNWKILIGFIAPAMLVFTLFPRDIVDATANYLLNYWVPVVLPVNMLGLPLLLLIVGKIKQKKRQYA